ncbi:hypothetical protein F4777DRAFT_556462 [Nemania sp. FL0916]|nr:hypothetical protein F4777DRAFT_556462 [Nemania sp. FL0916]
MKSPIGWWPTHRHARDDEVDGSDTKEALLEKETFYPRSEKPLNKPILCLSLLLNLSFLVLVVVQSWARHSWSLDPYQQMYTPALDAIQYREQLFYNPSPSVEDDYAGPATPERNAKWKALHDIGGARLSKSEASRLHNKTAAAQPGSDKDYPIVFNVFHDLHCLDSLRLMFAYLRDDDRWNATYNPYSIPWPEHFLQGDNSPAHAYHCFNSIRQSLQCFSDVTPTVFQYHPETDNVLTSFNVVHTCRNFEAIHEWAVQRRFKGPFNYTGFRDEQGHCGPSNC